MPSLSFGKKSGLRLEVETNLCRESSRGHIVSSAERRQKVVKRVLVGDVDGLQAQTPSVIVTFEDVVFANGGVEQIAWLDPLRILVVIARVRSGNFHQVRGVFRSWAWGWQRGGRSSLDTLAGKSNLEFLVRGQPTQVDRWLAIEGCRCSEARAVP